MSDAGMIECKLCGKKTHSIKLHLREDHTDVTVADYEARFPGEPLLSAMAKKALSERRAAEAAKASKVETVSDDGSSTKVPLHELFKFGAGPATLSGSGKPIPITVLSPSIETVPMVPDVDLNYVFNIDVLKSLLMAIELNIPVYLWGHAGTGKTTIFEQIFALTRRPMLRVQHTANTEEEHIVGGWRLRDGVTKFELGPLPTAMRLGLVYMADEYDFGRPEVLSVYQAVLENKPLVIKEADAENRVIRPHPNFRFVATGNTNGTGDESGLYQGTNMQNAANYERFGVVEKMPYMAPELEERLVSLQADIPKQDAKKLVAFANKIRGEFEASRVGSPISPRSLIYAARIGYIRDSYRIGLEKAFINRLSAVDRETVSQVAQRSFS